MKIRGANDSIAVDLVMYGARQFGIKTRSQIHFGNLREYRMGDYTRSGGYEADLVTLTDGCSFLCVSGQRGTIAISLCMRSICVS